MSYNEEAKKLYLIFVQYIGVNIRGNYEYEFMFSENPDNAWGDNWDQSCPSACGDIAPYKENVDCIKRLVIDIKLCLVQDNSCFSMMDCEDGIIPICWASLDDPILYEDKILRFEFGDELTDVEHKLEKCNLCFELNI